MHKNVSRVVLAAMHHLSTHWANATRPDADGFTRGWKRTQRARTPEFCCEGDFSGETSKPKPFNRAQKYNVAVPANASGSCANSHDWGSKVRRESRDAY